MYIYTRDEYIANHRGGVLTYWLDDTFLNFYLNVRPIARGATRTIYSHSVMDTSII